MSDKDISELYDRLRETEAQTREQNERINALTQRVDSMLTRWDSHMAAMWRLVYVLVGAILSLALGPKIAERLTSSLGTTPTASYWQPICPMDEDAVAISARRA